MAKHPLRVSIDGDEEKIPELKLIIAASEISPHLKAFLAEELDKLKSNAAEIHLKDVEKTGGGFDLHISVSARHHGKRRMVQGVAVAHQPAKAAMG